MKRLFFERAHNFPDGFVNLKIIKNHFFLCVNSEIYPGQLKERYGKVMINLDLTYCLKYIF